MLFCISSSETILTFFVQAQPFLSRQLKNLFKFKFFSNSAVTVTAFLSFCKYVCMNPSYNTSFCISSEFF